MDGDSDEALMDRFCQGDQRAFEELFSRRAPDVEAYLVRMVRDRALAADLLQTTFLSLVRARGRFQKSSKVGPWLFAIAANAARDALRHRERLREAPGEEALEGLASREAVAREPGLQRALADALDELPVAQREAVVMHHLLGWTFEEMSAALGATAVALRIRAHRGMEQLRARLGHLRGELE